MNPFTFQVPSNILFEPGASAKLPSLVAEFGARRILLVTDRGAS
jgi:alcohol dehydrogenase class IV